MSLNSNHMRIWNLPRHQQPTHEVKFVFRGYHRVGFLVYCIHRQFTGDVRLFVFCARNSWSSFLCIVFYPPLDHGVKLLNSSCWNSSKSIHRTESSPSFFTTRIAEKYEAVPNMFSMTNIIHVVLIPLPEQIRIVLSAVVASATIYCTWKQEVKITIKIQKKRKGVRIHDNNENVAKEI